MVAVVRSRREAQAPAMSSMDRPVAASWLTRARALAGVLLLLVATAAALAVTRLSAPRTMTVDQARLVLSTVQVGSFHEYVSLTGTVQPRATVYLDAIDGGQVAEVLVEEGAIVTAGQPLVRLNNTNLQLQVLNSEAQLSEQLNRLTSTKLVFEQARLSHSRDLADVGFQIEATTHRLARITPLAESGIVKRADVEDADMELRRLQRYEVAVKRATGVDEALLREQIAQLDKTVKGLNRNLEIARRNLENLVIRAPVSGQLTSLDAHVGQSKSAGQRIGQVDQIDHYRVQARVDEHYLGRVDVGQRALVEVGGHEQAMVVAKVYPDVRDREFKVDLKFASNTPASVRRGQTLQVKLELSAAARGTIVANGPFYEDGGGQWVFVLSPKGTHAERRAVKLGRRNPESVEVLEGLAPGDRVITSSYESLQSFERIEVRGTSS
jgi:HlyD family secretion protein